MNDVAARCDLLCISPHSDDAEIALGGTVRRLADAGRAVWLCDLTRGELGSNGTPELRWREATAAAEILGVAGRLQYDLPDGFISEHDASQVAVVTDVIRRLRPRWVVAAPMPNRHPDHRAVPGLVRKGAFMARLAAWLPAGSGARVWPEGTPLPEPAGRWECEAVCTVCPPGDRPDAYFDVSGVWEAKIAALRCYASQFEPGAGARTTLINDPAFLQEVERWARGWGFRAGVELAEALRVEAAPVYRDLPTERWS
ncbi:PIG-L family deacetylase [bacterium]|nr:PIG-L family deacetylase [bacterium]MBU1073978.1 PIG-L family deacetylase [bacterium]MBU1674250.1 PIG-L family deacetylase [bacterium]